MKDERTKLQSVANNADKALFAAQDALDEVDRLTGKPWNKGVTDHLRARVRGHMHPDQRKATE